MADLKTLTEEMEKLNQQIKVVLAVSEYRELDDLSGLDGYDKIKSADELQQIEEYRRILQKLDEINSAFEYFERPIIEVSRIYTNELGRYETDGGYCYTSGSSIEFLREDEIYNKDTDKMEQVEVWTTSRVESQNGQYYIVGYSDLEMSGLKVRRRR